MKMTEEQKRLFDDLTPLRQEIALNSFKGMNDIDAYKNSSGKAKTVKAMEASVSQILGNLKVKEFLDSMNEVKVNDAIMSRDEMMTTLSKLSRTNQNDLIDWGYRDVQTQDKEGNEITVQQSFWTLKDSESIHPDHMMSIEEVSSGKDGLKIKRASRLGAMKQLAELAGYNAPKEIKLGTDETMVPFAEIIAGVDRKASE